MSEGLPASRVLEAAARSSIATVLIVGRTKEGRVYYAANTADEAVLADLFEQARFHVFQSEAA